MRSILYRYNLFGAYPKWMSSSPKVPPKLFGLSPIFFGDPSTALTLTSSLELLFDILLFKSHCVIVIPAVTAGHSIAVVIMADKLQEISCTEVEFAFFDRCVQRAVAD